MSAPLGHVASAIRRPVGASIELPGTDGNGLMVDNSPAVTINTNSMTCLARVARADINNTYKAFVDRWQSGLEQFIFRCYGLAVAAVQFYWKSSTEGPSIALSPSLSSEVYEWMWYAFMWRGSDRVGRAAAARGTDVESPPPAAAWTVTGQSTTGAASQILNPNGQIGIGSRPPGGTGYKFPGYISYISVRDGVDAGMTIDGGTELLRFDANKDLDGVLPAAASFVLTTGQTANVLRTGTPSTILHPPTYV